MNQDQIKKRCSSWTWNNSLPYLIACMLPTALLIAGYITPLYWTLTFLVLIAGIGLVDFQSIKIAGGMITFDDANQNQSQHEEDAHEQST